MKIKWDIEKYGIVGVVENSSYLQDPTVKLLFDLIQIHSDALERYLIKLVDGEDDEQEF